MQNSLQQAIPESRIHSTKHPGPNNGDVHVREHTVKVKEHPCPNHDDVHVREQRGELLARICVFSLADRCGISGT